MGQEERKKSPTFSDERASKKELKKECFQTGTFLFSVIGVLPFLDQGVHFSYNVHVYIDWLEIGKRGPTWQKATLYFCLFILFWQQEW